MSTPQREADSAYAWWRLVATLGLMTVGSSAMYVVAVVLPAVQAEFAVGRSEASIPYTLLMIGFGFGGILMGRLADRFGVTVPLFIGAAGLGLGFLAAAMAPNIWLFALAHGIGLGLFGCSATFAPLVADTSLWFVRRRGIAVGICASGNYLAGAVWPPIVQHLVETSGWRAAYGVLAVVCAVTLPLLALALRPRPPAAVAGAAAPGPASAGTASSALAQRSGQPFGLSMGQAQAAPPQREHDGQVQQVPR